MSTADRNKPLSSLIAKSRARHRHALDAVLTVPAHDTASGRACPFHGDRLLRLFVHSYLVWEAGTSAGDAALARLTTSVVDANELRVSLVDEIIEMIAGPDEPEPRAAERALRLKATLNDLFSKQHRLTLDHLSTMSKKTAWAHLAGLAQVPRFVAARVALVGLGVHAMPVDQSMVNAMVSAKGLNAAASAEMGPDEVASVIERLIPAGELLEVYACLQASVDVESTQRAGKIRPAGRVASRPTRSASGEAKIGTKREPAPKPTKKRSK